MNNRVIFGLVLTSILYGDSSWYEQKLEGWYYFEDQEKSAETPVRSLDEAEEVIEIEKRALKKLLSLALLSPTSGNVENYMVAQKKIIDRSAEFAAVWGKVLLEKPFLGDFIHNPTTSYGIIEKRDLDLKKRKSLMQELSKKHFLLLFFEGADPFSEKAAEVATLFGHLNNWRVKFVSLDGKGTQQIPIFETDKGLSLNLGVNATPSFYVIDPIENTALPVGAGLVSVSELEQNIESQMEDHE